MFFQIAVPTDECWSLRFFFQEDPEQNMEVCAYTWHVYRREKLGDFRSYTLYQVAKYHAVTEESLVKMV